MAEVVAAFAAISSFLQVIEFTNDLVTTTRELIKESDNAGNLYTEAKMAAEKYQRCAADLDSRPTDETRTKLERAVFRQQQEVNDEAQQLINKLNNLTLTPGLSKSRRVLEGSRKALRLVTERKDIEKRQSRLQELNALLGTAMLQLLLSKHEQPLEVAITNLNNSKNLADDEKVLVLARCVKRKQEIILESLYFEDMRLRETAICEAYGKTYRWAVDSDSFGLRTWLQSGEGIFWVCGKAGSGKSTLFRRLTTSSSVRELLRQWARSSPKDLIIASFFFWYLGSPLQKSTEGLLRSILHQLLQHTPALIAVAFPQPFDDICYEYQQHALAWSSAQLCTAIENVVQHFANSMQDTRVCIFVDGLDEYSGDQLDLIRLLRSIPLGSKIKLCVSSRPWNAFRNAFAGKVPNIRLEDITRRDILEYVKGKIAAAAESTGLETGSLSQDLDMVHTRSQLVDEIVNKAEGVFLWVYLVVTSVVRGFAEGDPVHMLLHRVRSFPSDLGPFFENIIQRADNVYKKQAHQALQLACINVENKDARELSSWLDYWLISRKPAGLEDDQFAYSLETPPVNAILPGRMEAQTQTFLSASCKDLLCMRRLDKSPKIEFLHRTVYEYLTEEMRGLRMTMNAQLPSTFLDGRIVHLLNLARLKIRAEWGVYDLESSARMSLMEPHPDQIERYMHAFHDCLKLSQSNNLVRPLKDDDLGTFAPLLAFNLSSYITQVLCYRSSVEPGALKLLAHAALGFSKHRQFGLNSVNFDTLAAIMNHVRWDGMPSIQVGDLWIKFLAQWLASDQSLDIRHAWNIAELFICKGARVHSVTAFCGSLCTAQEVLEQRVPHEWLLESHNPCLAKGCRGCDEDHLNRP